MEISQAISLLQNDSIKALPPSSWVDLGCGTGLFTNALAYLLKEGSKIYAVDVNSVTLQSAPKAGDVTIEKIQADFVKDDLPFLQLDGILMANSLHFVRDKKAFIQKTEKYLKKNSFFLLVEYDMNTPNTWVPYPVSSQELKPLFINLGYNSFQALREMPSIYNRANIYSALICK